MKRAVSLLLSAALLLGLLSACQGPADEPNEIVQSSQEWSVDELAEIAFSYSGWAYEEGPEVHSAGEDREWMDAYIKNAYDIQLPWEDASMLRGTGASAFEIVILRMEDSDAATQAGIALMSYIFTRQGDFAGYAPAEVDMVANGSIMQDGPFAALFICPEPDRAYDAVESALNGESISYMGETADADVKKLRDLLVDGQGMSAAELEKLDEDRPDDLNAYVENAYGLAPDQWEECAIARDTKDSAFEIAVFRLSEEQNMRGAVSNCLLNYLDEREAQFDGSSEEGRLLHGAIVIHADPYKLLLVCEDRMGAADTFAAASGVGGYGWSTRYRYLDTDPDYPDRCAFTAPNEDDMSLYDTSAIRAAWEAGNPSGLSQKDQKIYNAARKVLKKALKSGMSDYEKELAIYSWVVKNVNYDWTHQDRMEETPRESFEPYGGLVNHKAVCLGYAATFQLLMDLAGVECITVTGAAFESREDHGWNMVRLNGEWYCVDVTWDANYREAGGKGRQEDWSYFNVTSDYMADTNHQWDYSNTPEATVEDRGQG